MDASRNTDDLGAWRTMENVVEGVRLTFLGTAQESGEHDEARPATVRMILTPL